jgi:ketopantoate reductase
MGNNLSGPDEYVKVLGREQVIMGVVYAAGKRDSSLIRAMISQLIAALFGEIDGASIPRLKRLIGILRQADFKAEASTNIVDYQRIHALGVVLIGPRTMKHGSSAADYCMASLGCDPAANPDPGIYQSEIAWNESDTGLGASCINAGSSK